MDDVVFYSLYPDFCIGENAASENLLRLEGLRCACLAIVAPLVRGYIWQHQQFDLLPALTAPSNHREAFYDDMGAELVGTSSLPPIPLLYGHTRYGDNVEDEWFIVYLLLEISRQIPHLSIKVWDMDGDFVLIEAAYAIPWWLKPENSRNRVFIRQGSIHILPLPKSPADIALSLANPSLENALRVLADGQIKSRASEAVQAAVLRRLEGYPEKAKRNMHKTKCRIPVRIAQILKHEPQLVSLAVESFYNRDIDAMGAASRMEKFLSKGPEGECEMVNVLVSMSRAMYAQLQQQVFQAPRSYPMPAFQKQYQEAELGMKLACGFEMMYWERSRFQPEVEDSDSVTENPIAAASNLANDLGWQVYRKSLENRGYFRDLLEGSKEHRKLTEAAIDSYRKTDLFSRIRKSMRAPVMRIDELLALDFGVQDFAHVQNLQSDDDSWLYKGEEELTSVMQQRQNEMDAYEAQRGKKKSKDFDPEQLSRTMKAFVDKVSSFEGAEIPENEGAVPVDMEKMFEELTSALKFEDKDEDDDVDGDDNDDDDGDDDPLDMDLSDYGSESEEDEENVEGSFMDEYSEILQQQLRGTSIPKTFVQAETSGKDKISEESMSVDVDVNVNLVKNMLESYSSQQGMPGPASNLLGMMGLELPDDDEIKDESAKRVKGKQKL